VLRGIPTPNITDSIVASWTRCLVVMIASPIRCVFVRDVCLLFRHYQIDLRLMHRSVTFVTFDWIRGEEKFFGQELFPDSLSISVHKNVIWN
jgi:hypothetical protein